MILPPTSQIGYHHKVTNITMSPTSLSPDLNQTDEPVLNKGQWTWQILFLLFTFIMPFDLVTYVDLNMSNWAESGSETQALSHCFIQAWYFLFNIQ